MPAAEKKIASIRSNVAITSPSHLKQWLESTGRTYLALNALDLVDGLTWPQGVEALMDIIAAYRVHREATPTGETMFAPAAITGTVDKQIPIMKTERLTLAELTQCIGALITEARNIEPTWQVPQP